MNTSSSIHLKTYFATNNGVIKLSNSILMSSILFSLLRIYVGARELLFVIKKILCLIFKLLIASKAPGIRILDLFIVPSKSIPKFTKCFVYEQSTQTFARGLAS